MVAVDKADANPTRKIGLSCAECRRSKLKCDRVFPCQSCVRRGCAAICPDGILPATKGNKVLMAHAQELSKQVKQLTLRVRELEELLELRGPRPPKLKVENQESDDSLMEQIDSENFLELDPFQEGDSNHTAEQERDEHHDSEVDETEVKGIEEALGSLAIGQDGQMRYRGVTAGAEYLEDLLPSHYDESRYRLKDLGLPQEIMELAMAFPFGLKDSSHKKPIFLSFIPTQERALNLFDIYYECCSWMYNPIPRELFIRTFMDPVYGTTGIPSANLIHSHKLSVFFIMLANGALYDEASGEQALWLAARYHQLARAAISLDPMLTDATVATCEALFMMIRYSYNSDRSTNEERWLLTGLAARVAQMIGLQRDSGGWSLPTDEIQRRRGIFWDIWTWDTYTAIVNGRPGCLGIDHTDCQLPDDLYAIKNARGETEPGYQNWRTQYCITCLTASANHVFAIKTPSYTQLLQLDKTLRNIIPPEHLWTPANPKSPHGWPDDPKLACEQACARFMKESNLLYIHRSYFAQAIRQNSTDPFKHKFAPSVYAVITSARTICQHIHGLYAKHRRIVRHGWYFWTSVYSSCIVLSAVVVECPSFSLASECYFDLREAFALYEEGSRPCRSENSLRHMQKLVERAEFSLRSYSQGHGLGRQPTDPSEPDALDVLGGRKSLIVPKSTNSSPTNSSNGSNATNSSPQQYLPVAAPAPMPPKAGAVEMLNQYYQNTNTKLDRPIYDYFPSHSQHSYRVQLSTHPQALPQNSPSHVTSQSLHPSYQARSGQDSSGRPSMHLVSQITDGYPASPESTYSPRFEVPHMYSTSAGNIVGPTRPWHSPPHASTSATQQYPSESSPYADGNGFMSMGYNGMPTNGNTHSQQAQLQEQSRYMIDMEMSQSDIWSNFAQDFRP